MTRLAVTADLHASDYGARVDPATGLNARFVDAVEIARWIAADAADRGCSALIVAGDLTEERHPSPWRVALIRDALAAFGGQTILVRGNHDGLKAGRSIVDLLAAGLPSDHGLGFSRPGIAWVGGTAVCALPYLDRHWLRAQEGFGDVPEADIFSALGEQFLTIARGLYAEAQEWEECEVAVLVIHQGLGGGRMSDEQQAFLGDMSLVVDTGALGAIGFDAILAGHFHKHQVLSTGPLIAYAGSPHRVSFGEEHDPKGYLIVETDRLEFEDGQVHFEFVETPARPFVTIDYAAERVDLGAVEGAIVRALNVPTGQPTDDVVKALELAGAWEVTEVRHARAATPEAVGGLSETLSAEEALSAHFEGDDDREALVERGRAILAEVA